LKRLKSSRLWKKRYIRIAISALLVLISIIAFWFCLKVTLKSEYPLLPIDAGGMKSTLNIGDLIIVQGVSDASEIEAEKPDGDIIVFRKPINPDELIVQRAINKTVVDGVWYFRTQEDNASSPYRCSKGLNAEDTWGDGYFHQKFLIGKVVGKIPYLGYISMYVSAFLRTPEAMFLVIVLLCFVILLKYPSLLKKKLKPQTKAL
jgi:signal peptidase I